MHCTPGQEGWRGRWASRRSPPVGRGPAMRGRPGTGGEATEGGAWTQRRRWVRGFLRSGGGGRFGRSAPPPWRSWVSRGNGNEAGGVLAYERVRPKEGARRGWSQAHRNPGSGGCPLRERGLGAYAERAGFEVVAIFRETLLLIRKSKGKRPMDDRPSSARRSRSKRLSRTLARDAPQEAEKEKMVDTRTGVTEVGEA